MIKTIIIIISIIVVTGIGVFVEVGSKAAPLNREVIVEPVYTIGDKSYGLALKEKKTVVKFGPMFLGLYSGGLAFPTPETAKKHLLDNNWDMKKWDIYKLSGDFSKDVTNGHINKSLLVLERVET